MELNSRELAILIWAVILLVALNVNKEIRRSFFYLLKAAFNIKIVCYFVFSILWLSLCVFGLYKASLWGYENLKTVLVWGVAFIFVSLYELVKLSDDKSFFNRVAGDSVKVTAIVMFVVGLYTFDFWVELLLVPVLALITILSAVSAFDKKHEPARKFLDCVLAFVVVVFVCNAFYRVFSDFDAFATMVNFKDFIGPVVLTLLFLPFVYVYSLYVAYDTSVSRLGLTMSDELASFAKWKMLIHFGKNVNIMRIWVDELHRCRLETRAEVVASIVSMKFRHKRQLSPLPVASQDGWPVDEAINYLRGFGLIVGNYKPLSDMDEWFASSKMVKVGDSPFPSRLAYYVEGGEGVVRVLKLKLSSNNPDDSAYAESFFREVSESLLRIVFDEVSAALLAVLKEDEAVILFKGRKIKVNKEMYSSVGVSGGYSRRLVIAHSESAEIE